MSEKIKNKVSRRRFISAALAVVMAVSLFAIPMSASATEPNDTDYYYVDVLGYWVPAPMGQDTVDEVTDNGDGTYTVRLGYGYYYSEIYEAELIGKVIAFDGKDWTGTSFAIAQPPTPDGGYVTFNWNPSKDPNYIIIDRLDIIFTYADDPDWDNPVEHLPLSDVAFCPLGGPPEL